MGIIEAFAVPESIISYYMQDPLEVFRRHILSETPKGGKETHLFQHFGPTKYLGLLSFLRQNNHCLQMNRLCIHRLIGCENNERVIGNDERLTD